MVVLRKYGIKEGVLIADDTDKKRSKNTKRIYKTHKVKDKSTNGYFNGQSLVFLFLVTPLVSIPVGVEFYIPDPAIKSWEEENNRLRELGVSRRQRPSKPQRSKDYPTRGEIVLILIEKFHKEHPEIKIKCIIAEALYGDKEFVERARKTYKKVQVISQLRKDQNIRFNGKKVNIETYFKWHPGTSYKVKIRSGEEKTVIVSSARLYVYAHQQKRFVIAFKYEGEEEYRYLVATDLSWRTLDIIQAYTLRWLVEVFFEDWKSYEGWDNLAKQPDEEGSRRGLTLSLMLDHCLLFHPDQSARLENNLPAFTVGTLREKVNVSCLFEFVNELLNSENPKEKLDYL